jgi:hypothetical protein
MPNINLILGAFWLVVGTGVLVWSAVDPERNARMTGLNLTALGVGALALTVYNFARWWFSRPRQEVDWMGRPFPPRQTPKVIDYDPDLDFSKRRDEGPPPADPQK